MCRSPWPPSKGPVIFHNIRMHYTLTCMRCVRASARTHASQHARVFGIGMDDGSRVFVCVRTCPGQTCFTSPHAQPPSMGRHSRPLSLSPFPSLSDTFAWRRRQRRNDDVVESYSYTVLHVTRATLARLGLARLHVTCGLFLITFYTHAHIRAFRRNFRLCACASRRMCACRNNNEYVKC